MQVFDVVKAQEYAVVFYVGAIRLKKSEFQSRTDLSRLGNTVATLSGDDDNIGNLGRGLGLTLFV